MDNKKVLYAKYSSHRAPQYRICTSIVELDGFRYVEKHPLDKRGQEHIESIKKNYSILKDGYKDINIVPYTEVGDGLRFPFVEGDTLDKDIDYDNWDMDDIVSVLSGIIEVVLGFEGEYAYVDCNISNFKKNNDGIWLFDYEWVDTNVSKDFLRYRLLHYLYIETIALHTRIYHDVFLQKFGISVSQLDSYEEIEQAFQEKIHGVNGKWMLTKRYRREVIPFGSPLQMVSELNSQIGDIQHRYNLREHEFNSVSEIIAQRDWQMEEIARLRRYANNPIYRVYKGVGNRFKESKRQKLLIEESQKRNQRIEAAIKADESITDLKRVYATDYYSWMVNTEAVEKPASLPENGTGFSVIICANKNTNLALLSKSLNSFLKLNYSDKEIIVSCADDITKNNVNNHLNNMESETLQVVDDINSAIEISRGEYILPIPCVGLVEENALSFFADLIVKNPTADIIYTDEDSIDKDSMERRDPIFKPCFSPDTLLSCDYISHFCVYRRDLVRRLGGFNLEVSGAFCYEFALRATMFTNNIFNIPSVLYHIFPGDEDMVSEERKEYFHSEVRIKEGFLKARGIKAYVERIEGLTFVSRVSYEVDNPLVSIIIPSKDNPQVLSVLLDSLYAHTKYKNFEVIVVDNGSSYDKKLKYEALAESRGCKYLYLPSEFNFSYMCNRGFEQSRGEYILFLNDDTQIIDGEWLSRMVGMASLSHTGFVGAKLLYPDGGKIQHDGVVNTSFLPTHIREVEDDFFHRNLLDHNVIAVTAAAMMAKRKLFIEIGLFNETLPVAFNDVEICFRAIKAGYYNVVRNDVVLIHHESISRGYDTENSEKFRRMIGEKNKLFSLHPEFNCYDPFYNPNYCQDNADFAFYYDKYLDYSVSKVKQSIIPGEPDGIIYDIDFASAIWKIQIAGWAVFPGDEDYDNTRVLIEPVSGGKGFFLGTVPVIREDVFKEFSEVKYAALSGFRTKASLKDIPIDKYKIFAVHNERKYDLGRIIDISETAF